MNADMKKLRKECCRVERGTFPSHSDWVAVGPDGCIAGVGEMTPAIPDEPLLWHERLSKLANRGAAVAARL